jgi:hypothetical protein
VVKRIIGLRVPTKMTRARHTHPWINTKVRRKISLKNREHAKARRTKKKRDRDRYKRLQQEVQRETRKAHKQYMEDVVRDGENRNKFWSYMTSKAKAKNSVE